MKLHKKFEYLSYWFRYQSTYLEMKHHLKQVLKGKEKYYIKPIYHYDRNIGKTVALARLSAKYNIPIAVPTYAWKDVVERDTPRQLPKYFKKKKPTAIVVNEVLGDKKYNILLVEERLTDEQFDFVDNLCNGVIVGYGNIN